MDYVDYADLRDGVLDRLGIEAAKAPSETLSRIQRVMGRRLRKLWKTRVWNVLLITEQRRYRADWSVAATYAAPTSTTSVEVYYPVEDKYYQTIRAVGVAGTLPTDTSYWAGCEGIYTAADWAASTAYVVGNQCLNPSDGRYYQCHTAHTSGATFDGTKWGILTSFVQNVDFEQSGKTEIGEIKGVWDADPRVDSAAQEVNWSLENNGIVVTDDVTAVWIRYNKRPAVLEKAATWSSATTYVAGDLVTYESTTVRLNVYKALQGGTNKNPATETTYWELFKIPMLFDEALVEWTSSELLKTDGQIEKADLCEKSAELAQAKAKMRDGRGERGTIKVER